MRLNRRVLASGCAISALLAVGAAQAAPPESEDPILIVVNNWTSQIVLAEVAGEILKSVGYSVEYKPSDTQLQYTAMGNGDMHLQVEVWEGTMKTPFMKEVDAGRMIDAGSHAATTREDWWYPAYLEEACPGLPDWEALKEPACAEALATPETSPEGRYLAGPVDWEKPDQERIDALELPVSVVNAGQASTLWAELAAAYERKEPIMLFNWTPNWVEAKFEGNFVNFPDHDDACEGDASWGLNPDLTHDCGNPKNGWLKKGVWSGFGETWPCALDIVQNIDFTNAMIAEAAAKVDVEDMSASDAAAAWLDENGALVKQWTDTPACQS